MYNNINQGILSKLEKGVTIKLLGDSITAGGGSSDNDRSGEVFMIIGDKEYHRQIGHRCWASLFAKYIKDKFPNSAVINSGCSDINSADIKNNLPQFCSSADDVIILMIGANDRKQVNGMTLLYDNLKEIIQHLKQEQKIVILMSSNPSTVENESYYNRLYHMEDVNNVIACVASEEKIQFISHYNYIQDYLFYSGKTIDEIMIRNTYKADGLHPSDEVHEMIFRNLIQNLGLGIKVNGATW